MKRFNNILLIALGMVLVASCTKAPLMGGDEPLPKGTVGIQILLPASADTQVQGAESDAAKAESDAGRTSRATVPRPPVPGTESENRITNLKFFIAHTAADGKEVIKRIVEVKDVSVSYGEMETDAKWDNGNNMLYVRHMKNPDELHTVFVVANWADVPATIVEGAPLETLTGAITHIAAAIPTPDDKHPMVMSGFAVDHNFATTPLVKVPIEHQAARFKLFVTTSHAFAEAYKDELVFGDPVDKHITVEVGNTYNSSYVFRQAPPAIPASATELPISFQMARKVYIPDPEVPEIRDIDAWEFPAEFFLYLYENPVVGITEYAKAHATYFLINIPYYKKNDPTKQLTNNYYKFKVNDDNVNNPNPHAIVRNTYYDVFGGIMGFGSEDPMKAVEIAAEVTVKPWSDIDVNGDITDQKPPINSKLEILTRYHINKNYINGVLTKVERIYFWTDRPADQVRLDPIAKVGENFGTEINVADYFSGMTDLHLTPNATAKGGFDGYIDLTPAFGKSLPHGAILSQIKIRLIAGSLQKELTVSLSNIIDFLVYEDPVYYGNTSTLFDYNTWTGLVQNGKNGSYMSSVTQAKTDEKPYCQFDLAFTDATTSAVSWDIARTSCPSGWRLPRVAELSLMSDMRDRLSSLWAMSEDYWSATEVDANSSWGINFSTGTSARANKTDLKHARCVRDIFLPHLSEVVYQTKPEYSKYVTLPKSGVFRYPRVEERGTWKIKWFTGWKDLATGISYNYLMRPFLPQGKKTILTASCESRYTLVGDYEIPSHHLPPMTWAEAMGIDLSYNTALDYKGAQSINHTGCITLNDIDSSTYPWQVPASGLFYKWNQGLPDVDGGDDYSPTFSTSIHTRPEPLYLVVCDNPYYDSPSDPFNFMLPRDTPRPVRCLRKVTHEEWLNGTKK